MRAILREMSITRRLVLCALACLVLVLVVACAPAATLTPSPTQVPTPKPTTTQPPAPKPTPTATPASFAGKTITIVVPFAAGGAGDIIARVYARSLGRFQRFNSLTEMTAVICWPPVGEIHYFKPGPFKSPEDVVNAKGIIYG